MADRFYLLPYLGTGTRTDPRMPKYANAIFTRFTCVRYGKEPICLLRAQDVVDAQHTALMANNDVAAFPADLDQLVTAAQVNSVQTTLESAKIPGQWVTAGVHKYSTVLKRVWQILKFADFVERETSGGIFIGGALLDTTLGSLSANRRNTLANIMDLYGYDRSSFTASSTLRDVLTVLSGEFTQVDVWSDLVM